MQTLLYLPRHDLRLTHSFTTIATKAQSAIAAMRTVAMPPMTVAMAEPN